MNADPFQQHRDDVADGVLAAVCSLSMLGALLTTLGHPMVVSVGLAVCAAYVAAARCRARRVRERREDAADTLAGAAWRAQHTPHLVAPINDDRARDRVGVA